MKRIKQVAKAGAVVGSLAGMAAVLGPFFTGESVAAVVERVRRGFPGRPPRQPKS
jgi:hypothetical protein